MLVDGDIRLVEDALEDLGRLEQRWSRFLPTSQITRINLSGGAPVRIAPETLILVDTMIDARQATRMPDGARSCTGLGGVVVDAGRSTV